MVKNSLETVCELMPDPKRILASFSLVSSFDTILILAPPTSPAFALEKTLLTPIFLMMLVSKKSSDIFLYSGSSEGKGNPLSVVEL